MLPYTYRVGVRHSVQFPTRSGIIASPTNAWGNTFDLLRQANGAFEVCGEYAVVDICGPLSQKPTYFTDSYESILCRVRAALECEAPLLCLRIDSPGGDFSGSLETAECIRRLASEKGKKVVAFTDTKALSAGYALAMAASEVVVTPSAFVGSIGVWAPLIDETAADKARGVTIRIVPSGSKKAARNPHMGITDETVTDLQVEVNAMAAMFYQAVASARSKDVGYIESLEGGEVFGEEAVAAGLADRVVLSWDEFVAPKAVANIQGNTMSEVYKALRAAADKGDVKALRALKAYDGDNDDDDMKAKKKAEKEEEEKKAKAKAEEEEKEKKAKAAEEEKKKEDMAKAQASGNELLISLTRELHEMKVKASEDSERAALLASRPDFSDTVRKTLMSAPISVVKEACTNWPRAVSQTGPAQLSSEPTRGATQTDNGRVALSDDDKRFISERMSGGMSLSDKPTVSRRGGRELEFGQMSSEAAAAFLGNGGSK